MMTQTTSKSPYTAPSLKRHGRVEALTAGNSTGLKTDAAFNAGDPFGDVTFS
ncbi:MAG: lasso RiPP family leader peptide-containing protein [Pseudomonadota bacterium]